MLCLFVSFHGPATPRTFPYCHTLALHGVLPLCVENPTHPEHALPDRVHVRTYPVRERYGFMWFWAGDGDADVGLLPHFPQYESDGYGVGIAYKHVAGSYQLLIDNLLDLSDRKSDV